AQDVSLIHDLPQRALKQRRVNRPADIQVLGDIVCGVRRVDSLGEPDSLLGICQRMWITIFCPTGLPPSRQGRGRRVPIGACHSRNRPYRPVLSRPWSRQIYRGCVTGSSSSCFRCAFRAAVTRVTCKFVWSSREESEPPNSCQTIAREQRSS